MNTKTERQAKLDALVDALRAGASEKEARKLASAAGYDDALIEQALALGLVEDDA